MTKLGTPTTTKKVARQLHVTKAGVDLFELRAWLQTKRWNALVLHPRRAVMAAMLKAGLPVVAVRVEQGGDHAVALIPVARMNVVDKTKVRVIDIRQPVDRVVARKAALSGLRASLVMWPQTRPAPVEAVGGTAVWRALLKTDAEFRAIGWLRRAREHTRPNLQKLTLYGRALAADPCYEPARREFDKTAASLPPGPTRNRLVRMRPNCRRSAARGR